MRRTTHGILLVGISGPFLVSEEKATLKCHKKLKYHLYSLFWSVMVAPARFLNRTWRYYDVFVKSNYKFEKPFLWLAGKLVDDSNLEFVASSGLLLCEVKMDKDWQLQNEADCKSWRAQTSICYACSLKDEC
uniref:Uncharacterized protein n=1 Tax=Glossina brevipalpis TaxID=37001 RepID=A0A1A9WEC6_9MUSC